TAQRAAQRCSSSAIPSFRCFVRMGLRDSGGADQVTVKPMEAAMLVSAALATAPLTVAHPGASMASSSCISSSSATSDGSTSCSGAGEADGSGYAGQRSASPGTADLRPPRRLHGFPLLHFPPLLRFGRLNELLNAVLHRRFLPFVLSFRLAEDSGTREERIR